MIRRISIILCCLCFFVLNHLSAQVIYIKDGGKQDQSLNINQTFQKPAIKMKAIPIKNVKLLNSIFSQRYELNKKYLMSLENDKLLQNFYYEAGITKTGYIMLNKDVNYKDFYWGWDSPNNQLRGHFLGHWLSAILMI